MCERKSISPQCFPFRALPRVPTRGYSSRASRGATSSETKCIRIARPSVFVIQSDARASEWGASVTSDSRLGAESRTNLKELWRAALGELQLAMPKANYDTWFKETYVVSEEDDVFCIGVPNAFAREWLENKYRGHVRASLQRLVGRTVDVRFITVPGGAGPAAGTGQRPANSGYSGHNVDGSSASVTPVAPPTERRGEGE